MMDDVAYTSTTIKALVINVQCLTWNFLDLFENLVYLANFEHSEIRGFVQKMLDKAVRLRHQLVSFFLWW